MARIPKINESHGSETYNIINRAIEVLNKIGIDVQTLVAEGQLTPSQYAELITLINDHVKSGEVDKSDLTSEFKDEIERFSSDIDDFNSRVDEIITTPVDGNITQQEIIDSRQGKSSLGENLTSIKDDLKKHKDEFATNAIKLNNVFNVNNDPPRLFLGSTISEGVLRSFWEETRNTNSVRWFGRSSSWLYDNFETGDIGYMYLPVNDYENVLWIRIFENINDAPYLEPRHIFNPTETGLKHVSGVGTFKDGSTFDFRTSLDTDGFAEYDLNRMVVLNLTKIFGEGNEPSKQKMDSLIEQIGNVEGELVLSQQQLIQWESSAGILGGETKATCYLEVHGLDKENGRILGGLYDLPYNAMQRTGKFLRVSRGTNVNVEVPKGTISIMEYNDDFVFLGASSVLSGADFELSNETNLIKVLVENLTVEYRLECKILHTNPNGDTEWVKNQRISNDNIQFLYEVDYPSKGRIMIDTDDGSSEHIKEKYYNSGLLKLPRNYDPFGKPTKLIVFCQGSADYSSINSSSFGGKFEEYFDYLADEGYAILAAYSWTTKYPLYPQMTNPNFGSPISIAALTQAYDWAIDNFNIDTGGVYVSGKSAGGYKGLNLCHNKSIPVRAAGLLAPAIFPITHPFGYDPETRRAYADDFGFEGDHSVLDVDSPVTPFTEDVKDYLRENIPKIAGYNPLWNGLINKTADELLDLATTAGSAVEPSNYENAVKINTVPTKIWAAEDESLLKSATIYTEAIQNGQGIGELRVMPAGTGGHNAVDSSPDAIRVDSITTELGVTHTNVPLAYVELAEFFKRF